MTICDIAAQVYGQNAIFWEEKFDWDFKYVNHFTFKRVTKIILDTARTAIKRDGMSAAGEATMSEFMGSKD